MTERHRRGKRVGAIGKQILAALLLCVGLCHAAAAETAVYVFPASDPPLELAWTVTTETPAEMDVVFTFAGDCTLGGMTDICKSRNSFASVVEKNDMAYPFEGQQALFAADDFTIVNLEGVLSDSTEDKTPGRKYNFIGDTRYGEILTLGSVECANLANNHSGDYGRQGSESTKAVLDAAGIGYMDEDTLCILEKDGVRIGLTATLFQLPAQKEAKLAQQIKLLKSLGCAVVVHTMHAGTEYAKSAGAAQKNIAQKAASLGAALVVGHHPHVLQNAELIGQTPVIYSLGNNSFGGNLNPKDKDALLLRAVFHFKQGEPASLDWALYPISISGKRNQNDFRPVLLDGQNARRVIDRVAAVSASDIAPYEDGQGAQQSTIVYKGVDP